jgi:ParB-like chromosome segregation protein Spo0J
MSELTTLEVAEQLVAETHATYVNAKSALRLLKQSTKADRAPSARDQIVGEILAGSTSTPAELAGKFGLSLSLVSECRAAAKGVLAIRAGFAPPINERFHDWALKLSGVSEMPTAVQPVEEKPAKSPKTPKKPKLADDLAAANAAAEKPVKGKLEDALAALAEDGELTVDGLIAECHVSKAIAVRALREFEAAQAAK